MSIVISNKEPTMCNAGTLHLPLRSISIIAVQAPTELNTQDIYQLNASVYLPSGIIPLAVNYRIHHKCQYWSSILIFNTAYDAVHVPRKTMRDTVYQKEH